MRDPVQRVTAMLLGVFRVLCERLRYEAKNSI